MLENQLQLTPEQEELVETFAPLNPLEVYSPHTIVTNEIKSYPTPTIITREGHSVGKTEEYKRSDHLDFCTSKELKDRNFSGVRHNSISNTREIWIEGDMRAAFSETVIQLSPQSWTELYSEVFGLKEVIEIERGN